MSVCRTPDVTALRKMISFGWYYRWMWLWCEGVPRRHNEWNDSNLWVSQVKSRSLLPCSSSQDIDSSQQLIHIDYSCTTKEGKKIGRVRHNVESVKCQILLCFLGNGGSTTTFGWYHRHHRRRCIFSVVVFTYPSWKERTWSKHSWWPKISVVLPDASTGKGDFVL